jgi:hypothetical protein
MEDAAVSRHKDLSERTLGYLLPAPAVRCLD